jgi:hypothetical protein
LTFAHRPKAEPTTREGAEEFARDDQFVLSGVVRAWRVLSGT